MRRPLDEGEVGNGFAQRLMGRAHDDKARAIDGVDIAPEAVTVAWALGGRFESAVAVYVDDAGVTHFVVGTPR